MNKPAVESVVQTINECWPFARLDPENQATAEVWWNALSDLPTSAIGEATIRLARSEEKRPPSPGQFRRMCTMVLEERNFKSEYAREKRSEEKVASRGPKENAWAATQAAFARRIAGPDRAVPGADFETDFDVEYVVRSVSLPATPSLDDQREAFHALKACFEREWAEAHGTAAAEDFA